MTGTEASVSLPALLARFRERLSGSASDSAVLSGAAKVFMLQILGYLLGFVLQFLLARTLGHDGYGRYAYVLGWMNIAVIGAKLEADTLGMRLASSYTASQRLSALHGLLRFTRRTVLLTSGVVSLLSVGILLVASGDFVARIRGPGIVAALLLPPTVLLALEAGILQGLKVPARAQLPNSVLRPAVAALLLGIIGFVSNGEVIPEVALGANLIACIIALMVAIKWRSDVTGHLSATSPDQSNRPAWIHTMFGLFGVSIAQMILSVQTDVVIVGTFADPTVAGNYAMASQLSNLCFFGPNAVVYVGAPIIAELHAQGKSVELERMVRLIGRLNLALALPVFAGLVLLGSPLLGLFGDAFRSAYPILLVLGFTAVTIAPVGGIQGFLLTMTGHEQAAARLTTISAIAYLLAAVLLTPHFGPIGTAWSSMFGYAVRTVLLNTYIVRKFRINPLPLGPTVARSL